IVNSLALFRTITMPIVMTPLLLLGYDSIALVIVSVSLNVIALISASIYCYLSIKIKISFKEIDFCLFKDISAYSFFILLNILVDKLYAPTSQYILGVTTGTAAVAIYAIGIQLTTYFTSLSTSLNSVFLPRITTLVINNKFKEISDIFIKIGRLQFLILIFVLSGFTLFGREFIVLWAGADYINSYYIALIIMIPSIIPLSQNMAIVILQARNQLKFRVITYLVIAIFSVALSYYLSAKYLEIGPAVSVAIATILGQIIIMNVYYSRNIQLNIIGYWKQITPIIFKVFIFGLSVYVIKEYIDLNNNWGNLALNISVYSILYFIYMYVLVLNNYERSLIKSVYSFLRKKY
ncbi:MAG: polysaccharide biosynthesis C-terminal domain-containing protein, partial [Lysinibacillus sp.]